MQDLLGDVHDLDVLRQQVRRNTRQLSPALVARMDRANRAGAEDSAAAVSVEDHRARIALARLASGISVGTRAGGQFGSHRRAPPDRLGIHRRTLRSTRPNLAAPSASKSSAAPIRRATETCSKHATPAFFSSVKGARAPARCAIVKSRCGAWPKHATSFARRCEISFTISEGFPAGFRLSLTRILSSGNPSASAKISAVCAARTSGLVISDVGLRSQGAQTERGAARFLHAPGGERPFRLRRAFRIGAIDGDAVANQIENHSLGDLLLPLYAPEFSAQMKFLLE